VAEFLFEIGFEEMPASWLSDLAKQLQTKFDALASEAQLAPTNSRVLWTSRRLVLVAEVKARQDDRTVVEWGPAAKIAKDAAGNWSKAAEGFAKKQGVGLDVLTLAAKVEGSADLYVSAKKHIAGRATGEVLSENIAALLRSFNFPKRMNWDAWLEDGRGAFEFGRPIQWIVALLDGVVVPFTIFNATAGAKGGARLAAGRRSKGNRFYPRDQTDRAFDVKSFADLDAGLASRFVILDPSKRAERIRKQVEAAGGKVEGEAAHLIAEWNDLVEYPTLAVGSIPKEFADLPHEVLETVLAHHQKAIMLPEGPGGVPRFAAISGCDDAGAKNAALGQERVVVARLKDARFFWNEDRKRTLESRVDDLATVMFQRGLGSYKDKAVRISTHAQGLAEEAHWSNSVVRDAGRAGLLAKADLVTLMVREFPELQGTMGGLYGATTESPEVATGIRWHYQPTSVELGSAPEHRVDGAARSVFAAVALADKLDTIIGYFGLGQIPSGSSDPYGLRRAGQGVVRVLLDFWDGRAPDIAERIGTLHADYSKLPKTAAETQSSVLVFLIERMRAVFSARGAAADEIDAVLSARVKPFDDVRLTQGRLKALSSVRAEQPAVFAALAESFKRAKNIVGEVTAAAVDENLFVEDAERRLYSSIKEAQGTPSADSPARLRAVAGLRAEVDAFFTRVMVNAEEPTIRANRHAILHRLLDLVYEIADLSKLASPAGESATSS
jgi:glycyl-tRNA synthetase beta chain